MSPPIVAKSSYQTSKAASAATVQNDTSRYAGMHSLSLALTRFTRIQVALRFHLAQGWIVMHCMGEMGEQDVNERYVMKHGWCHIGTTAIRSIETSTSSRKMSRGRGIGRNVRIGETLKGVADTLGPDPIIPGYI